MQTLRILLIPFSLLYGLAVFCRNALYDIGVFRSHSFKLPVILVGNLSTGGTGKTPHVDYLIRLLKPGYKVATLSRGYGRETKGYREATLHCSVTEIGDEPLLYKTRHPDVVVTVCEDRASGIRTILKQHPEIQVIIMDDGFQHRRVKPGFSLLLTPWQKPWFRDYLLPAGNLREQSSGRHRANCAVITRTPADASPEMMSALRGKADLHHGKPVFFSSIQYGSPLPVFKDAPTFPERPAKVVLFAGIADADRFVAYAESKFGEVDATLFSDHHIFTERELVDLSEKYQQWHLQTGNAVLLTTEKDAMRLRTGSDASSLSSLPLYYLPIDVVFHQETASFDAIIHNYVEQNQRNSAVRT